MKVALSRGGSRWGRRGLEPRSNVKLPNFLKIDIIGFCLTTSSRKSNFHANHTHHTHNSQNWSVEPLPDFRLDPPLLSPLKLLSNVPLFPVDASILYRVSYDVALKNMPLAWGCSTSDGSSRLSLLNFLFTFISRAASQSKGQTASSRR